MKVWSIIWLLIFQYTLLMEEILLNQLISSLSHNLQGFFLMHARGFRISESSTVWAPTCDVNFCFSIYIYILSFKMSGYSSHYRVPHHSWSQNKETLIKHSKKRIQNCKKKHTKHSNYPAILMILEFWTAQVGMKRKKNVWNHQPGFLNIIPFRCWIFCNPPNFLELIPKLMVWKMELRSNIITSGICMKFPGHK